MRSGFGGLVLLVAAGSACSRVTPSLTDAGGVGVPDASPMDATPLFDADASADTGISAALDTALPPTGRQLPAGVHAPVRFFDGSALLVGKAETACTHQIPASGDGHRWCAFTIQPAVNALAALWVIDVTRAATGDVPRCDGTDPGCVHLTDKAYVRAAIFFDGDTLIYGTDSVATVNTDFLGRIFAWRPGWSGGRQISSDKGFTCAGSIHSAAALCFDDPLGDPTNRDSANIRAGDLSSQQGGQLPVFGRYPLRNDDHAAWQANFSPDGSVFVLSNADAIGAPQNVRVAPTATIGQTPPTLALADAAFWQVSNDGKKIYFLRNLHGLDQLADLYVADFPSGANPSLIESELKAFTFIGDQPADQAVLLWKNHPPGGTIELLSNRAMVAPKVIFTHDDFLNGAIVSPDLRYTTWLNDPFIGTVFRNVDLATCTLNGGPHDSVVSGISYLAHSGLMFWKEIAPDDPAGSRRDAYFARPDSCTQKTRFARHVDLVAPIDDRGLVFTDEQNGDSPLATLKYVAAASDGTALDPAGAVRIQENVLGPIVPVGANPPMLVYSANGGSADSTGLYVFGPVPF